MMTVLLQAQYFLMQCFMSNRFGTVSDEMQNIKRYISNIESRSAFQKAITLGAGGPGDALGQ